MTNLTFRFDRSTDFDLEDDMHVLLSDGIDTRIAVQDARSYGGGCVVNQYLYEGDRLVGCSTVSTHRSLKAAKAAAEILFSKGAV